VVFGRSYIVAVDLTVHKRVRVNPQAADLASSALPGLGVFGKHPVTDLDRWDRLRRPIGHQDLGISREWTSQPQSIISHGSWSPRQVLGVVEPVGDGGDFVAVAEVVVADAAGPYGAAADD
jgi:hypothetical protein